MTGPNRGRSAPPAIITKLRSGESTLRDPTRVVLAHTLTPKENMPSGDWMLEAIGWGCLVETAPGIYGMSLLGAWWLSWKHLN